VPKLTDRFLASFKPAPGKKDRLAFDTECRGLGVRTTAAGTRTFIVQWTDPATTQKRREPLGVWGGITVDQAREAARACLGDVAKGIDPRAVRLAARQEAEAERAETQLTLGSLVERTDPVEGRMAISDLGPMAQRRDATLGQPI
jgi:hypothetical protein